MISIPILSIVCGTIGLVCVGAGVVQYLAAPRDPDIAADWHSAATLLLVAAGNFATAFALVLFEAMK